MTGPLYPPSQHPQARTAWTPHLLQRQGLLRKRSQRERRSTKRQPKMGAKVHPGGKKPPMTGNEAHVFVKSPNEQRAQQLCQIAERCCFASSIHPDTDKCLEELGQLMKDNRVLPSAIIVDIYDENGDGMVELGVLYLKSLGVCGGFTPSMRVVSRREGDGWFLFRV